MSSARPSQDLIAGSRTPESHDRNDVGPRAPSLRRMAMAVLTVALAVGAPLVAVQPADAVASLATVQRISLNNSTAEKVVSVPCPSGTRAIGGSAVVGGSTRVRVNSQVPDAGGDVHQSAGDAARLLRRQQQDRRRHLGRRRALDDRRDQDRKSVV